MPACHTSSPGLLHPLNPPTPAHPQIYDPPQKLMHRHNEIHLPAGQKKKKQQAEQVLAS